MNTKRKGPGAGEKADAATVVVVSRLSPNTHQRFKVYAEAQRRSVSKQIRVLIEDAIDTEGEEAA